MPAASPNQPQDAPILNIIGDRVALGPQRRDLVSTYQRWLNDFAVLLPLGAALRPLTEEAELRQYEETSSNPQQVWFTVYLMATGKPLGISGLRDIDAGQRTAQFVILLGEKGEWGKGYGTETTRLMLDYGFTALGLHNIMLKAFSYNERGLRAYRRAGFREIGRRREAHWFAGQPYDVVYMDCLASEFQSPLLRRLLP